MFKVNNKGSVNEVGLMFLLLALGTLHTIFYSNVSIVYFGQVDVNSVIMISSTDWYLA